MFRGSRQRGVMWSVRQARARYDRIVEKERRDEMIMRRNEEIVVETEMEWRRQAGMCASTAAQRAYR